MLYDRVSLNVNYGDMDINRPEKNAELVCYILGDELLSRTVWGKRPAVIVCAGGGYSSRSAREAEPIALKFCAAGFHAFVLEYSTEPTGWPAPTCELSNAVAYVRSIAEENYIDEGNIYVCGFSAGGHLTASLGVYWNDPEIQRLSNTDGERNRPNGLILAYPVIIDEPDKTHMGTYERFTEGKEYKKSRFGLDKRVSANTPECFIWHTFSDNSVPVLSSMRFASALLENGIKYELHIYPDGSHGLALGNRITACQPKDLQPETSAWIDLAIDWIMRGLPPLDID